METIEHAAAGPGTAADDRPWHALETDEVALRLESPAEGLDRDQVLRRRQRYGLNRLPPPPRPGALQRVLRQFNNALISALLGAAAVTALLQHWIDTAVILGVVVINAIVGAIQEGKAEKALQAVTAMLAPMATVIRDGQRSVIPAEELVPGDRVLLRSGDRVPADLRLVQTQGLQIEESALTGESLPVEKSSAAAPPEAGLGDRHGVAFSGTLVTQGRGTGIVIATGEQSELGRIGTLLAATPTVTTPLLRRLAEFGRVLTFAILAIGAVGLAIGVLVHGRPLGEMFLAAVGLAVAAIPEGLPAIMTIALAISVTRMARRNAIIRQLPAVEALGSVTVICSDKTGTLTKNELDVQRLVTAAGIAAVGDPGWRPDPVDAAQAKALEGAALCHEAELVADGRDVRVIGNPFDQALLQFAHRAGADPHGLARAAPRRAHLPFESEHKYMASLHDGDGGPTLWVKGAPERLLELADEEWGPEGPRPIDRAAWRERLERLAADGDRVIALACRADDGTIGALDHGDVGEGLVLVALVGVADPPRPEAIEAVAACRAAGIRVKMITGDHLRTAAAIGARFGLTGKAISGHELDRMDEARLKDAVGEADVFARTTPTHKIRLVQALQARGEVVAMTGDGVNDAPALKRAEIGVAMGIKGTEAAKQAAVMVLADDNFASIAHAVEEGRTVYDNLKKSLLFVLPTNGGEGLVVLAAMLVGQVLPLTPVQVLWVNMVTAVTLALALAFDRAEPDIMRRPPRSPDEPLLDRYMIWRIVMVSFVLMALVYATFLWNLEHSGGREDVARTAALNILVACEAVYLLNCRHIRRWSLDRETLAGNPIVWLAIGLVMALQLLITYVPWMNRLFDTAPIGAAEWGVIALGALGVLVLVEIEKAAVRRLGW